MALTDQLVAYWKLEEASGNRADATGRGHTLAVAGSGTAPTSTSGKQGGAVAGGTWNASKGLTTAAHVDLDFGNFDWSIAGWVRSRRTDLNASVIGNGDFIGGGKHGFAMYNWNGLQLGCWLGNGTSQLYLAPPASLTVNTWAFVAVTYNAATDTVTYHMNALTPTTGTWDGSTSTGRTFGLLVSPVTVNNYSFEGDLDEVGVWARKLSAAEVADLYNGGTGKTYPFAAGLLPSLLQHAALGEL